MTSARIVAAEGCLASAPPAPAADTTGRPARLDGVRLRGEPEPVAGTSAGLGVRPRRAPCRCTGAPATTELEATVGPRCHRLGAGSRIEGADPR